MLISLSMFLAAQASAGDIRLNHSLSPDYVRTEIDAACGDYVVRIEFRNAYKSLGDVEFVMVNDRNVLGAAAGLRERAGGRYVDRMGIMNCGPDPHEPVILGVMEFSPIESQRDGLPQSVFFRLRREGGAWRIVWERER